MMVKEKFGENKFFVFESNQTFSASICDFDTVLTVKIEKNSVITTDHRISIISHFFQIVSTNRILKTISISILKEASDKASAKKKAREAADVEKKTLEEKVKTEAKRIAIEVAGA
jgi:hypothetical protein